jgi:hypothetical protein
MLLSCSRPSDALVLRSFVFPTAIPTISCADSVRGSDNVLIRALRAGGSAATPATVLCPAGCAGAPGAVYGCNNTFSAASSVCKAALLAGMFSSSAFSL